MLTQKDAVFEAVSAVLQQNNIPFEPGTNLSAVMNREIRSQVKDYLFDAFAAGKVALDKFYTEEELKTYISGLQSNWLRKDKRFGYTN